MNRKLTMLLILIALFTVAATIIIESQGLDANTQSQCKSTQGYWHFNITDVKNTTPPDSINVEWTGGITETVPLDGLHGNVAGYKTQQHMDLLVTRAWAVIGSGWGGVFTLSCSGGATAVVIESFSAHLENPFLEWIKGVLGQ